MYDTRLDHNQIKNLADYIARRKATEIAKPLETDKFIEEYTKTYSYSEVFTKLLDVNYSRPTLCLEVGAS